MLIIVAVGLLGVMSCSIRREAPPPQEASAASHGERLAQQQCGTCHLAVSAASLDKETWLKSVLPAMAPKLGVNVLWENEYYMDQQDGSDAALSLAEWKEIVAYFRNEAPDSLHLPESSPTPPENLPLFDVRVPQWDSSHRPSATGMVAIQPSTRQIYSSDVVAKKIYRWDQNLEPTVVEQTGLLGVDVSFSEDADGDPHGIFTSIGTMRAVNAANGEVRDVNLVEGTSRVLAQDLPRPVCSLPGDYNKDGLRDWIVCGFGHDIGSLYLLQQQPDHTFAKTVLRDVPGAVDAQAGDFNHDGWLDVMVLFAHADEGVWLFENDARGGFDGKNVLRFPPVYGSSSLQLADVNGDHELDILYTSGDNADYSNILKPYHGVYVFVNQGPGRYKKSYFYHLDGATKAIAADFDDDGDLDISAIAFFASLNDQSAHNFVYLEQTGPLKFAPHAPDFQRYGRWISMDAGDVNGDTDLDLVLGNYARRYPDRESRGADANAHIPFVVLENQTH